jgi:hypothetical protein
LKEKHNLITQTEVQVEIEGNIDQVCELRKKTNGLLDKEETICMEATILGDLVKVRRWEYKIFPF